MFGWKLKNGRERNLGMKLVRSILAVIVIILAVYIFVTDVFEMLTYSLILLGLLLITMGVLEFRVKKKATAVVLFLVDGFDMYVAFFSLSN